MKLTTCIFLSVIVLAGCNGTSPLANRKPVVPQASTNTLAKHKGIINQYLEAVDKAILAKLPNGKIDRMTRSAWQDEMQKQFQDKVPARLGIELWSEAHPVDNFIRLRIQCNILGLKQIPVATISPILTISVPERNIRLDWYITTENELLDKELIFIAIKKMEIFQQKHELDSE